MKVSIGDRIRVERYNLCMTQREFADYVGVSLSTITDLENDHRLVSVQVARKLANALGGEPQDYREEV